MKSDLVVLIARNRIKLKVTQNLKKISRNIICIFYLCIWRLLKNICYPVKKIIQHKYGFVFLTVIFGMCATDYMKEWNWRKYLTLPFVMFWNLSSTFKTYSLMYCSESTCARNAAPLMERDPQNVCPWCV